VAQNLCPADHADIIVHNDEPLRPAWEVRSRWRPMG
jgi:hypothetical protein